MSEIIFIFTLYIFYQIYLKYKTKEGPLEGKVSITKNALAVDGLNNNYTDLKNCLEESRERIIWLENEIINFNNRIKQLENGLYIFDSQ